MSTLFLYTLELRGGYLYVGTTKDPTKRLSEHRQGTGAVWTMHHPPVRFSKLYPLQRLHCSGEHARLQEDAQVKKVMLDKGMDLVRGGSYSSLCLSRADIQTLSKELYHAKDGCLRCGHQNHWAGQCRAVKDVAGNVIEDADTDTDTEVESGKPARDRFHGCNRCGRGGHTEDNCYARVDVHGDHLDDSQDEEQSSESEEEIDDY